MRIVKRADLTEPPTKEEVVSRAICRGDRRFQTSMQQMGRASQEERTQFDEESLAAHCNDNENNNDRVDDCTERRDKRASSHTWQSCTKVW